VLGISLMAVVLARLVQRWRDASPPLRRATALVFLVGGALLIALSTVLAVGLFEDYGDPFSEVIFYGCLISFGLVPYAFLIGLVRGRWIRGRGVGALISRLGQASPAGGLRDELARALGYPSLELAYWLPDSKQYVGAEGRPVRLPGPQDGRAVTEVERDGRRIAAVVHDPTLLDDPDEVRAAGAAAALSLENERLEAELRAKVEQLSASRAHRRIGGRRPQAHRTRSPRWRPAAARRARAAPPPARHPARRQLGGRT
jgi:hypothetical protein